MVFNMSVGYNLEGILRPNVQWYFDAIADASAYLAACVEIVARRYPAVREIATFRDVGKGAAAVDRLVTDLKSSQ